MKLGPRSAAFRRLTRVVFALQMFGTLAAPAASLPPQRTLGTEILVRSGGASASRTDYLELSNLNRELQLLSNQQLSAMADTRKNSRFISGAIYGTTSVIGYSAGIGTAILVPGGAPVGEFIVGATHSASSSLAGLYMDSVERDASARGAAYGQRMVDRSIGTIENYLLRRFETDPKFRESPTGNLIKQRLEAKGSVANLALTPEFRKHMASLTDGQRSELLLGFVSAFFGSSATTEAEQIEAIERGFAALGQQAEAGERRIRKELEKGFSSSGDRLADISKLQKFLLEQQLTAQQRLDLHEEGQVRIEDPAELKEVQKQATEDQAAKLDIARRKDLKAAGEMMQDIGQLTSDIAVLAGLVGGLDADQVRGLQAMGTLATGIGSVFAASAAGGPAAPFIAAAGALIHFLNVLFGRREDPTLKAIAQLDDRVRQGFEDMHTQFEAVLTGLEITMQRQARIMDTLGKNQRKVDEAFAKLHRELAFQFRILQDNLDLGLSTNLETLNFVLLADCKRFLKTTTFPSYAARAKYFAAHSAKWRSCQENLGTILDDLVDAQMISNVLSLAGLEENDGLHPSVAAFRSYQTQSYAMLAPLAQSLRDRYAKDHGGPLTEILAQGKGEQAPGLVKQVLAPKEMIRLARWALEVEPYLPTVANFPDGTRLLSLEELRSPRAAPGLQAGRHLLTQTRKGLEMAIAQQAVLAGDLTAPLLATVLAHPDESLPGAPSFESVVELMAGSAALSRNVLTAFLMGSSPLIRRRYLETMNSPDGGRLSEVFGPRFTAQLGLTQPGGEKSLRQRKFLAVTTVDGNGGQRRHLLALPEPREVHNRVFHVPHAIAELEAVREDVLKRLYGYERSTFAPPLAKRIEKVLNPESN